MNATQSHTSCCSVVAEPGVGRLQQDLSITFSTLVPFDHAVRSNIYYRPSLTIAQLDIFAWEMYKKYFSSGNILQKTAKLFQWIVGKFSANANLYSGADKWKKSCTPGKKQQTLTDCTASVTIWKYTVSHMNYKMAAIFQNGRHYGGRFGLWNSTVCHRFSLSRLFANSCVKY